MLRSTFYQQSLEEVDPDEIGLEKDSFELGLREMMPKLVTLEDFRGFRSGAAGTHPCCPLRLSAMYLLAGRYGLSDKELMRRCHRDLGFRYALGLPKGEKPPSLSSYERFRRWLRTHRSPSWLDDRVLALAVREGLLTDTALAVVDSTSLESQGAVMDTLTLISAGIGHAIRTIARGSGHKAEALAEKWRLSRYLSRSIKGNVEIDWASESDKNGLLNDVIRDAKRVPSLAKKLRHKRTAKEEEALALLARVTAQDVEKQEDGSYKIVKGVAKDRIISIHDPHARHGRKSSATVIAGYKTHVLTTTTSRFVIAFTASAANLPDGDALPQMLDVANDRGLLPDEVLGDQAYGQGEIVREGAARGVAVRSKVSAPKSSALTKKHFDIDLEHQVVTCPNGHESQNPSSVKANAGSDERVPCFRFPKTLCRECPLADACGKNVKTKGRVIILDPHEPEIQRIKAFNADPLNRKRLRKRCIVEGILSQLVRMGLRQAHYRGIDGALFQVGATVAAYNLQRLITLMAKRD